MEKTKDRAAQKKELRRRVLQIRENLSEEERKRGEILITERLLGHQWFYGADTILGFVSYGSEIGTQEMLLEALRKNKRVFVPRVEKEQMQFYRILSLSELAPGYKGIPEPDGTGERYQYDGDTERTLLVMPGVAFDPYRNRLGYGRGFYDRFLGDKPALQIKSIAIGYRCQMVEQVPCTPQDLKPYQVICV